MGDYIHSITSHSENCSKSGFIYQILSGSNWVDLWIKLSFGILKAYTIHQITVKTVIKRFVQVITWLVIFFTFSKNSGKQVKRLRTEMSSWFSNNFISQRIIFCGFQGINCLLWQLTSWKASSNVQYFHLMTILSTNFYAFSCIWDGSFKGWWPMLPRTTVEMNSHQTDSHLADLKHSFCNFLFSLNIIPKLVRKWGWQMITLLLLNGNSPKDFHVWSVLNNFVKLIDCIGCCEWNAVFRCPFKIFLFLDRIGINNIVRSNSKVKKSFDLMFWSTVKITTFFYEIQ